VRIFTVLAVALALAAPALASEQRPTLAELEDEVMCLLCKTSLAESQSPFADQERTVIRSLIAKGYTKSEIKKRLVAEYGDEILAAPPKSGFNLLAWWLPIAGAVAGALVLGVLAWRWSRGRREPDGESADPRSKAMPAADLEPELARRLDEELARFDA
jgi:cytochrome c-type biogenesis protein CcmH